MLGLHNMSKLKQAFFSILMQMKCFDLQSTSLLIIILLIRFLSQIIIISFSSLVTDSTFTYLLQIYKFMTIYSRNPSSTYFLAFIIVLLIFSISFIWTVVVINFVTYKGVQGKIMYMKIYGLFVYTFRVLLVKNLAQIAYIHYQANNISWVILLAIVIIMISGISIVLQEFCIQISLNPSNKSMLSKSYHPFNSISQIVLLITVVLTALIPNDSVTFTFILSVLLAVSFALKLLTSTLRKKYTSPLTECLQKVNCVSGIVFYLSIIPGYYVNLLKQNLFVTMFVVTIFCFTSYMNYLNSFRQQSMNFLQSIPHTKQQLLNTDHKFYLFQAHYLIHYINYMIAEYKGQKQQILLSSILAEHFKVCKKQHCYCTNKSQQNINRLMMDKQFRGMFLLAFVQNINKQFSHQFDIFSVYLMFKLEVIGIFPQIQYNLLKYEMTNNNSLSISQQYIIFQIKNTLKRLLNQKNRMTEYVRVQKAILQEQKSKKLRQSLHQILDLSIKRYKLLSQGICNLKQVQDNLEKTSAVIKIIQLAHYQSKQKNQFNLYTQSIFYFYYTKISQTNSQAAYIANNIYSKSNFLKSLKGMTTANIQKFLYQDQCCVLQSNLDPQNMGVITNLTQNFLIVFDLRKQQLLYRNIKKIMPKFMNQQHQKMMQLWLSTSNYGTINQQKSIFMSTVKNVCFKTIVYHQISTSFDRIKIYTMILKLSGQNYLLLDRNMKIEGFGQKIKDSVFTIKTFKEPIKNFCLNPRVLPEDIQNLDIQKEYKIDLLFCQQKGSFGQIRNYNTTASFAQQIQQFANKALRGNRQVRVLKCKAQLSGLKFGKLPYCVIKFLDVVEHTMLQSDVDQIDEQQSYHYNYNFEKKNPSKKSNINNKKKVLLGQNSFTPKTLSQCPQQQQFYQQVKQQQKSSQGIVIQNQSQANIYQLQQMQKQSTSSIATDSTSYSFKKLIKQIKQKFIFQKHITYRQLNNVTIALVILVIMLFASLITQYIFYRSRLQSFQQIMTANQQVSDTLQYMELMYSQSLLIYQNCILLNQSILCKRSMQQLIFSYNYLFQQVSAQTQELLSMKATQDFLFYMYLRQNITVKLGDSIKQMQIQSFISIFYYTVKKIAQLFQSQSIATKDSNYLFSILVDNWEAIIQMNHRILQLYQQKGLQQMTQINIVLFCISGAVIIIDLTIIILINYFMNSFINKKQQLVRNYQWVPISYIEEMKKYFESVIQSLQQKKINKKQTNQFPNLQDNSYFRPKNQFFYTRSSIKRIFFLVTFFLCLTLGNVISLWQMRKVLEPFETIFIEQKSMIASQKTIIQGYYELKTCYLLQKNATIRNQKLKTLQNSFQKKSVEFNDRAIKLLQIFNDSSSYFNDFKHLLKDDICQISKELMNQWEYTSCKNANFDYPQYGIFSTMIFIQRATMIAASVLKQSPIYAAPFILGSATYQDIDLYIVYTVKVFYMMQKRINRQMQNYLQNAYFACLLLIMLQFMLALIGIGGWIVFYSKKKKQFTKLYGHVILYPNKIIIKNKQVMKQIEDGLVIKDY